MTPTTFPQQNGTLGGGPAARYGTEDAVTVALRDDPTPDCVVGPGAGRATKDSSSAASNSGASEPVSSVAPVAEDTGLLRDSHPPGEGAERVTHKRALLLLEHHEDSLPSSSAVLRKYVYQQEQAEREAAGLREQLRQSGLGYCGTCNKLACICGDRGDMGEKASEAAEQIVAAATEKLKRIGTVYVEEPDGSVRNVGIVGPAKVPQASLAADNPGAGGSGEDGTVDPRPRCVVCASRWVPPEGMDATVARCGECNVTAWNAQAEARRRLGVWDVSGSVACILEAQATLLRLADYHNPERPKPGGPVDGDPHRPDDPLTNDFIHPIAGGDTAAALVSGSDTYYSVWTKGVSLFRGSSNQPCLNCGGAFARHDWSDGRVGDCPDEIVPQAAKLTPPLEPDEKRRQ